MGRVINSGRPLLITLAVDCGRAGVGRAGGGQAVGFSRQATCSAVGRFCVWQQCDGRGASVMRVAG